MPVFTLDDARTLTRVFDGRKGAALYKMAERLTGVSKINKCHTSLEGQDLNGPDFAAGILDKVGVDFAIGNSERLFNLPEGAFVTISNHAYGHMDGIFLVDVIGHLRPAMKVMVNQILMYIKGLAPSFISVTPNDARKNGVSATSISGVREAIGLIRSGEPLSLFPAGAVSDLKPREHWTISDRQWQVAVIKLIRKLKVPVVPIRFYDRNSAFYYSLGLIDWKVRLLRLCHELFNKSGTHPRVGIGETISVEQQLSIPEEKFGDFLRESVYGMPLPEHFTLRSELSL